MFRKKWVEILVTDDRTAFFAAKNALEAKNIPYRTDVTDNNLRVSMNPLGAGPGRDGFVKTYYKILVEEKYAPAAGTARPGGYPRRVTRWKKSTPLRLLSRADFHCLF